MSWKEWKYNRLNKKIHKDEHLLGYIGNRLQNNRRKKIKMENEGEMMVISD